METAAESGLSPATGVAARTRVKVCGLTRPEDAAAAARLGADAAGVIFHPPSPRGVDLDAARAVRRALPPYVSVVGVFVNPTVDFVERAVAGLALDLIQFHGDETPEFCERFQRPYIKAVPMREGVDLRQAAARYAGACALMLDSFDASRRGGTGKTFDWSLIPPDLGVPFILAGGLTPENVARAIDAAAPFAVDANGGVESSPGIKDHSKIEQFIREVNHGQTR